MNGPLVMGIYDREYYRREGPSFLGALTGTGQVCKWLILANVAVFIVQMVTRQNMEVMTRHGPVEVWAPGWFTEAFVLNTDAILRGQIWRLLSYAFLHDISGGLPWHIIFNMLFLWWFGSEVEGLYGAREFLAVYLVAAVVGGLAFVFWALATGSEAFCLGASGAVTAVMVLFAFHFPTRMIYIWFILPVPIWAFVAFQIIQDSFVFLSGMKTTTAVAVHLGGAAFATLYYKMNWRLLRLLPSLQEWQRRRSQPRLRVYREDEEEQAAPVSVSAAPRTPPVDEHLEAQVDALLDKVARFGKESLTESERQLLLRAGEIYKRRRT
jgi:membrane associated rhomboid family serine protease